MRIGFGNDVHRLVADRPLVLGGITIKHQRGLEGHSDADVLTHAICDALLGAAGLGDIGEHFPDSDARYHNIYSIRLLEQVRLKLDHKALRVVNLDATVIAQQPKLNPYKDAMRQCLAAALKIPPGRINIKATTTEGLGMLGCGDGIAAMCIALLETGAAV
jgi:2-C-methyl-D-erythritol 2,4-cyclodiphosphate synthase